MPEGNQLGPLWLILPGTPLEFGVAGKIIAWPPYLSGCQAICRPYACPLAGKASLVWGGFGATWMARVSTGTGTGTDTGHPRRT